MKTILVTGATGNIGREVLRFLRDRPGDLRVIATLRDPEQAPGTLPDPPAGDRVAFDFQDPRTFDGALRDLDCLFLLRPPQIADVQGVFRPLLEAGRRQGLRRVVFLSVQGADKSPVIPHHKIERLILELGFDYIFIRPSYFMQNLTTTLYPDIRDKRRIILPAGRAPFNWVDTANIGEAAARLIENFEAHKNQAYDLTGSQNLSFPEVVGRINQTLGTRITYQSVDPFRFFWIKRRDGLPWAMIGVLFVLHFLPRFTKEPKISTAYRRLTGKDPTTLEAFIRRERAAFSSPPPPGAGR